MKIDIKKTIEAIKKHQENSYVHPLTCGNNSLHNDLVPVEFNNNVVLICKDCNYVQSYIPEEFIVEKTNE